MYHTFSGPALSHTLRSQYTGNPPIQHGIPVVIVSFRVLHFGGPLQWKRCTPLTLLHTVTVPYRSLGDGSHARDGHLDVSRPTDMVVGLAELTQGLHRVFHTCGPVMSNRLAPLVVPFFFSFVSVLLHVLHNCGPLCLKRPWLFVLALTVSHSLFDT